MNNTSDLPEEESSALEMLLADEYVLYMRTRDGSRNIPDTSSAEAQDLLQRQCASMGWIVAGVSKMVRKFGPPPSFVSEKFIAIARLSRHSGQFTSQNEIVKVLLNDHESMIRVLRNHESPLMRRRSIINTAEFMTGLLKQHEELAGALKEWLE